MQGNNFHVNNKQSSKVFIKFNIYFVFNKGKTVYTDFVSQKL